MKPQITAKCQTWAASFHLMKNIGHISDVISQLELRLDWFMPSSPRDSTVIIHSSVIYRSHSSNGPRGCKITLPAWSPERIKPILEEFYWLPVAGRIDYKILVLTIHSRFLYSIPPSYLTELLHQIRPCSQLWSLSQLLLKVPSTRRLTYMAAGHSQQLLQSCGTVYVCHSVAIAVLTLLKQCLRLSFLLFFKRTACSQRRMEKTREMSPPEKKCDQL